MTESIASVLRSSLNATSRPRLRRTSQLLPLEQRFMFDGAAVADADHAAQTPDAASAAAPALPPAVTVREAEPAKDNGKKEVVLVDTSLADYKTLEAGVRDGVGIVEFDGSKDGLAQIAQWASTQSGLDAIHILSHGSEGVLNLGTAHLTESSLSDTTTQAELAQLGSALNADGDLMLYGCDTGDSVALLNGLAQATGADVAASTDVTGAARLGGNWSLEAHSGLIDSRELALAQYDGVLATVSFDGNELPYDYTPATVVKSVANTSGVGAPTVDISFSSSQLGFDAGGLYPYDGDINGDNTRLTISITSGYSFDLSGLSAAARTGQIRLTLTYSDGSTSTSFNQTAPLDPALGSVGALAQPIDNVTRVVIESNNYAIFQDFIIVDVQQIPAPPTTTVGATLSYDTGTSNTDFITKTAAQTIDGTLSTALATNEWVEVSYDNGANWSKATSYAAGLTTWSATTTLSGSDTFLARVANAGGKGTAFSHTYTLDTTPPTTIVSNVHISADTGSGTDFITSSAAQTITATLSGALAGTDVLFGSVDNGATWDNITSKVSGTTVTWNGATLASGDNTIKLKVLDNAYNDGTVTARNYTLDTTKPTTPDTPTLQSDTGVSSSDKITKDTTPTLTGTAEIGSTVKIYDNGAPIGTVIATDGSWNYTTGALTAGNHNFTVTATDAAGNDSAESAALAVTLDTTPPVIASVEVPSDGSYRTGNTLNFTVHTDDPVYVDSTGGTPRLVLTIGATTRYATYASGEGTNTLVFSYVVQAGDNDSNGIAVSSFSANGGTVTDVAGNALGAALNNVASTANVLVDTVAPVAISVSVPASATYYAGDTLDFTVYYNEAVTVNTNGGTPRFSIDVGGTTRYASYVSGSGTSALLFRYTVVNGDTDADGINLSGFSFNGGTLSDASGNAGNPTINGIGSTAGVLVDASNPGITGVSASTADGSYGAGQTVTITVDFSTAVDVDTSGGTPSLALDGGGTATYTGGSGTSTLTFSYTVGSGQNSADLDYSGSSALALNGASIVDAGGAHTNAALTLAAPGTAGSLGANKDLVIDTAAPTNTGATVVFSADSGTPGDFITNTAAQNLNGTLTSNLAAGENVYVSLNNGGTWHLANANTGSKLWSLTGQTLTGSDTLKVRITDAAGNDGPAYEQNYVLDTTPPTITISGLHLSADNGISGNDFLTNVGAQTITATLSAAPAGTDVVYGSIDGGASWTNITSQVSGTSLTWVGETLVGSNTLQLKVTDAAGNDGTIVSQAYVIDTTTPFTSVATVSLSNDSNLSGDFITNIAAQTVSGTLTGNLAAGEQVLVSLDNGTTWHAANIVVGTDSWSLTNQTLTASDTLQVKVTTDAGGSGAVTTQAYVYDTVATVPVVDALQTPSLTPVLTGSATLAAGETMTVTVGGATYDVVPVAGAWSLDLASAVPVSGALSLVLNQHYNVTATVTDLAGNVASDTTSGELIVGSLTPPTPPTPPSEGFQTPPVVPEPLPPISYPVSLLPPPPGVGEQSSPLPTFTFDSGSSWESPNALQPGAELSGGMAELLSPTAGKAFGGAEGLGIGRSIDNVSAASGERITKQIDAEAFMHNMPGQNVVLSADLADGRPLPGWLKFNARDGRFEGVPPPGFSGKLLVRVTARDGLGHEASQQFEIVIGRNDQAQHAAPAETHGRSGLSQQLRDARSTGSNRMAGLAAVGNRAT